MQASEATIAKISEAQMLTLTQAARLLGLKPVTLRAWAARRRIAVHRLGRAIRISASEVERLLEESLVPAAHERDAR
jgi:excisionase family DNA binding protein